VKRVFKWVGLSIGAIIAFSIYSAIAMNGPRSDQASEIEASQARRAEQAKKLHAEAVEANKNAGNRPSFIGGVRPKYKVAIWDIYKAKVKYSASIHLIISGEYDKLGLKMLMRETFEKAERELYPPYGTPKSVYVWAWTEEGFKNRSPLVARITKSADSYLKNPKSSPAVEVFAR